MHSFRVFFSFPGTSARPPGFIQQKTASRICEAGPTNSSGCQAAQSKQRAKKRPHMDIRQSVFFMAARSLPASAS